MIDSDAATAEDYPHLLSSGVDRVNFCMIASQFSIFGDKERPVSESMPLQNGKPTVTVSSSSHYVSVVFVVALLVISCVIAIRMDLFYLWAVTRWLGEFPGFSPGFSGVRGLVAGNIFHSTFNLAAKNDMHTTQSKVSGNGQHLHIHHQISEADSTILTKATSVQPYIVQYATFHNTISL